MASVLLSFIILVLCSTTYGDLSRIRRGVSRIDANQQIFYPTLPEAYGTPSVHQESHLQGTNFILLNQIHSELSQIEALVRQLLSRYNTLYQNTASIKSLHLPSEYGSPAPDTLVYNYKVITDNAEAIQSSIKNLKSIAQHLQKELATHEKQPYNRISNEKIPVINPNQHYHINAAGVLPEFLTLDPFVGYGPAPNVNFAPPAPGPTSDSTSSITDLYSPPDGVLLAPPAPGLFPIRTRVAMF